MAGFLTDLVNNQVLDSLFGCVPFEPPPSLYVGLSLVRPYKGGFVSEPPGSASYRRVAIPNDLRHFPPAVGGRKTNAGPVTFPKPTGCWGIVRSVFVASSATGSHTLAVAELARPVLIDADSESVTIAAGALMLSHS